MLVRFRSFNKWFSKAAFSNTNLKREVFLFSRGPAGPVIPCESGFRISTGESETGKVSGLLPFVLLLWFLPARKPPYCFQKAFRRGRTRRPGG
jgi:hypothetical protein